MSAPRHYNYIGPKSLLNLLKQPSRRLCVRSAADVETWFVATQQPKEIDGTIVCTFIIDLEHQLWINDRRSEHVVCAAGAEVLSAGEITFRSSKQGLEVTEITNQSTGYCPEPDSWRMVQQALAKIPLKHPDGFTTAYIFRRCTHCRTTNLVKDGWFMCAVCDSTLSAEWNFDRVPPEAE